MKHKIDSEGVTKVISFTDVEQGSPEALKAALVKGPVSIAIDAGNAQFQLYNGGIMMEGGSDLDHGVLLVGYGTDNGVDYWLVRNSWGSGWGMRGYFKVLREMNKRGPGVTGLQMMASYPIM